jgi:hypothetical protein
MSIIIHFGSKTVLCFKVSSTNKLGKIVPKILPLKISNKI